LDCVTYGNKIIYKQILGNTVETVPTLLMSSFCEVHY